MTLYTKYRKVTLLTKIPKVKLYKSKIELNLWNLSRLNVTKRLLNLG